jgi:hypothetical protein
MKEKPALLSAPALRIFTAGGIQGEGRQIGQVSVKAILRNITESVNNEHRLARGGLHIAIKEKTLAFRVHYKAICARAFSVHLTPDSREFDGRPISESF